MPAGAALSSAWANRSAMPSRRTLIFALTVLLVALATGAGALWLAPGTGPKLSSAPPIGGSFTLTDQSGRRVTERSYAGKYLLVFFGYTYCPDVCPSELQVMSAALDQLGPEAEKIQPLFITIDPGRDTPQVMKDYVSNFNPRLVGLTGSAEEIAAVAGKYRVYYAKAPDAKNSSDYLMDHSAILYLMQPDGTFLKHFTYGTDPKALADSIRKALES
jgi:cytochrome oxidase Cu insertion factor (SCO1/SenC/PrrC family)